MSLLPKPSIRELLLLEVKAQAPKDQSGPTLQHRQVLDAVARKLGATNDQDIEQAILTEWDDLYRTGLFSWGLNLMNPNPPFFHLTDRGGAPVAIRSDNGPEVSSRHFLAWCIEKRIDAVHIQPQTHAERAHRKFQRQASRRVSERELVLESVRRTGEDRGLAGGLQLAAATLGAQVLNARRVRAESRFAFFNFEYHTSGSASRLP